MMSKYKMRGWGSLKSLAYAQWMLNLSLTIATFFIFLRYVPTNLVSSSIVFNPFAAGLGEQQSVAPSILAMKGLAQKFKIIDYDLSSKMNSDTYIFVRSLEFLYPLRKVSRSNYLYAYVDEELKENCHELGREGQVVLYECK